MALPSFAWCTTTVRQPGGHPYLVIFDFDAISSRGKVNSSKSIKEVKFEETRNVSAFAVDPAWRPGRVLLVVAAVGKRLFVYKWQTAGKTFERFRVRPPGLGRADSTPRASPTLTWRREIRARGGGPRRRR